MGVSGCGKSSIAEDLATSLGANLLDADDFHPAAKKAKMSAGTTLNDEDRAPWLEQLRHELASRSNVVLACSALKRRYRDVLRKAGNIRFVYLDGSLELIERRMQARQPLHETGHAAQPIRRTRNPCRR